MEDKMNEPQTNFDNKADYESEDHIMGSVYPNGQAYEEEFNKRLVNAQVYINSCIKEGYAAPEDFQEMAADELIHWAEKTIARGDDAANNNEMDIDTQGEIDDYNSEIAEHGGVNNEE